MSESMMTGVRACVYVEAFVGSRLLIVGASLMPITVIEAALVVVD